MDVYEKPPVCGGKTALRAVIVVFILIAAVYLLPGAVKDCIRYIQVADRAVTVNAEVSRVETQFVPEDGFRYDVYIRYSYGGASYEILYRNRSEDAAWMTRIGQGLSVDIDPDRPGELTGGLMSSAWTVMLVLMMLNYLVRFFPFTVRESWTAVYGTDRCFAQRDLERQIRQRWLWIYGVLLGLELIVLSILAPEVFPVWLLIPGVMIAFLGFRGAGRFLTELRMCRDGVFAIQDVKLVDKHTLSRRRSRTRYYLTYCIGQDRWRERVSEKEYDAMQIGQTRQAVFFEGKKRPELVLAMPENAAGRNM